MRGADNRRAAKVTVAAREEFKESGQIDLDGEMK